MRPSTGPASSDTSAESTTVTVRFAAPGVLPGTDYRRALQLVEAEIRAPHLSAVAELPGRGHHASLLGRTAAHLSELYAELTSYGWRLVPRPGADHQRAATLLSTDVDTLADVRGERAEAHQGGTGPVKLEVLGPVSLAAQLHLSGGEKVLIDHGARRDLAESLADGLAAHAAHVRRAVSPEELHVVVLEPDYAAVRSGDVPTASGYQTIRSLARDETQQLVGVVVDALRRAGAASVVLDFGTPVGHEHLEDFRGLGAAAVDGFGLPVHHAGTGDWERAAELVEAGAQLWASLLRPDEVSGDADRLPEVTRLAARLAQPWAALGMPLKSLEAFTVAGFGAADRSRMTQLNQTGAMRTTARLLAGAEALTDQIHQ